MARFHGLDYSACTGSYDGTHVTYWNSDPLRRKTFSGLMPTWHTQHGWSPHTTTTGGSPKGKYGVRLREVTDGLSKTIAIVETSGQLIDNNGGVHDGNNTRLWTLGPCCADWQPTAHWGTTMMALPVGQIGKEIRDALGGPYPITSGHGPSGMVVMGDGSVHHFNDGMDIKLLYALGDRADGTVIDNNSLP
jgi:hypothetical protein